MAVRGLRCKLRALASVTSALLAGSEPPSRCLACQRLAGSRPTGRPNPLFAETPWSLPVRAFSSGSDNLFIQAGTTGNGTSYNNEAAAEEVLVAVDRLVGEGQCDCAVATLEAGAQRLSEQFGPDAQGLLPIYGQLALLRFVEGDYQGALHAAQRCYAAVVQRQGEGSAGTLPHAVRYGIMLLASGDAEGALPLLQYSGSQLESLVRDLEAAAAALPSRAELGQLQAMLEQLFDYAVALGEATFYHSLCRIAHNGSSKDTILREESGLLDGLETLKHALEADHVILSAALREHSRLVLRSLERGHKLAHIELALQNKRLHDAVRAPAMFGLTTDEED